jgi:hypothetical protein
MKRFGAVFLVLLATAWCSGQNAAPKVGGHGSIFVTVKKPLDSSKLKEGDPVEVELSQPFKTPDGTLIAKGSKVVGHITEAEAKSKGDARSRLVIAFDKIDVAGGKQISVKGVVQAVAPPAEEGEPIMFGGAASGAAGGGYTGATVGTVSNSKSGSNVESDNKQPVAANPQVKGVQSMHDLQLEDGVLSTSKGKQVKLGQDVRMIVHIDILE